MRLIDADALMAKLTPEDWRTPDERWMPERQIGAIIQNAPTVDAVNYCESCAWCEYEFVKSDGSEDKRYRNHKWCGLHKRSTKKDGFCHWHMEKRGGDNEID